MNKSFKTLLIALVCAYTTTLSVLAQGDDAPAPLPPIQAESGNKNEAKRLEYARSGKLEALQAAIKKGANIHRRMTGGNTIFTMAAIHGDLDTVTFLAQNYPQLIEQRANNGLNAIYYATSRGHLDIVIVLAQHYPQLIEQRDKYGMSALHDAAEEGHLNVVRFLAQNYPQLIETTNNNGRNALHYAAEEGHLNVVRFLVQHCPQLIEQTDEGGNTPLHRAARDERTKTALLLAWAAPKLLTAHNNKHETPLFLLAQYSEGKNIVSVLKKIAENKKNQQATTFTPSNKGNKRTFSNTQSRTSDSDSKIHKKKKSEKARTPASKNEPIEVDTESYSDSEEFMILDIEELNQDLLTAAQKGDTKAAKKALDLEANPNIANAQGNTPLHFATLTNNVALVELLLERGANPSARNHMGLTIPEGAQMMGHNELFNTLQNAQSEDPVELLNALRNLRIHPQAGSNEPTIIDLNAEDDDDLESMNWDDDDQEESTQEGLSLTNQAIASPTTAAATAALLTAFGYFSTNGTQDAQ